VTQLAAVHHEQRLEDCPRQLQRTPFFIVDEVGCIPFDAEAANLFFQPVSPRYERISMIVTSNKLFTAWGEIFGGCGGRCGDDRAAGARRGDPNPDRRILSAQRQKPCRTCRKTCYGWSSILTRPRPKWVRIQLPNLGQLSTAIDMLIGFGITGLFLVALSALSDWFKLPSIVLASSLALLPIGLYLRFIARSENNTNR
jgi:hypothetical protein